MSATKRREATIGVAGWIVCCPDCGRALIAPETEIGRTMWTEGEVVLHAIAYCPDCNRGCAIGGDTHVEEQER